MAPGGSREEPGTSFGSTAKATTFIELWGFRWKSGLTNFVYELLSIFQLVFGESGRIVSSWKIRPRPVFLEDQLAAWDRALQDLCRGSKVPGTSAGSTALTASFIELQDFCWDSG